MNFTLSMKSRSGSTMFNVEHISAITIFENEVDVHLQSGTIFTISKEAWLKTLRPLLG